MADQHGVGLVCIELAVGLEGERIAAQTGTALQGQWRIKVLVLRMHLQLHLRAINRCCIQYISPSQQSNPKL